MSARAGEEIAQLGRELASSIGGPQDLYRAAGAPPAERTHRPPEPGEDPLGAVLQWCAAPPAASGPLAGKRISVKASIAVAGVPMSCGFRGLESFRPAADSVVVERLLGAGASVVAVTNMDCLGMAAGGETSGFGPIRNPHDRRRTAGGSSSGAAAGLSYGNIDIALGTDQGGSIRVPASWCGALGLKPTHGAVPYGGCAGIEPGIDHVGPLASSAADLAAAFHAIAGLEPAGAGPERRWPAQLSIGLLSEGIGRAAGVEERVAAATRETGRRLAELGAEVREVSVPEHLESGPASLACNAEGTAALLDGVVPGCGTGAPLAPDFALALGEAVARHRSLLSPQTLVVWEAGRELRRRHHGAAYAAALSARPRFRAAYDRALDLVDVLLMPTTPYPAYAPPADRGARALLDRGWAMLTNTEPFNFTGHPAISLPTGAVDGLPVGAMLVARHGEERLLLEIAACYEREHGWTAPVFAITI